MKTMKVFLGLYLIVGMMGCSAALVNSDFDRDTNFAGYQTFDWAPQPQKADSAYVALNTLLEKRLHEAVEREFAARGFRKQTTGTPDFLITYDVTFRDKVEAVSHDYWSAYYGGYWPGYYFGYWSRYYHRPGFYGTGASYLREFKEATLTLDVLDPETRELIWRGWYIDEVEDVNIVREEKITEAVRRILEKFPPERKKDEAPATIT